MHIERPETAAITSWACGAEGEDRLAFLLDRAGSGKTVVMHDAMEELERNGVLVLAVRADQQLTGVETDKVLQERLGLPERFESAIGRMAQLERVVVLVDQVDALSLALSGARLTLDYTLTVIARLRSIPNVRIVVSCRSFDYSTDPRLRQIQTDRMWHLEDLRDEDVASVVRQLGGEPEQLLQAERELFRTPLHLGLYGRLLVRWREVGVQLRHFRSLQELYEELWRLLILAPELGDHGPEERVSVLRLMTEYMIARRTTSVPRAWLERPEHGDSQAAIGYLASSGVLISGAGERTWTFLHQTFLDYCYARGFVERGASLANTILSGAQGLFERSQMIQVLSYLRAVDELWYRTELHTLMDAPDLQPHLEALIISWLADLADPAETEWESVRRLLLNSTNRPRMLRALHGKIGWWPYLRPGMNNRLQQPDEVVDGEWIPYLSSVADDAQDEVTALVEPYFGRSRQWDDRVGRVLYAISNWSSPAAVRLYGRWVRSQPDVNVNGLLLLPEVATGNPGDPEVVCGLLRYVLDELVEGALNTAPVASQLDKRGPVHHLLNNLYHQYHLRRALEIVSERVPVRFVQEMLPWLERVAATSTEDQDDADDYRHNALASGWYYGVGAFDERFIGVLVGALQEVARTAPDVFREHAARLQQLPFVTAQRLIAVAYTAAPEHFREDALTFLLEDGKRLILGDHDDFDSLKLIQALCPYLSPEQNARLEEAIIAYQRPIKGNAAQVLRSRELRYLRLLSAMSLDHLTPAGRRRLQELEHKYGEYHVPERPFSMVMGAVASPIEPEATEKMSNAQWLGAIAKYSGDAEHPDLLRGGADELAHELARRTKDHPVLSYELAMRGLAPDVDARYLDTVMRGLSEAEAPASLLFDVVHKFRDRQERDFRLGAAWALRKRVGEDVPDELLDLLEAWARGPALDDEDWWRRQDEQRAAQPGTNYSEGDPHESYLNSFRGSALEALLQALHAKNSPEAREREWSLLVWISQISHLG